MFGLKVYITSFEASVDLACCRCVKTKAGKIMNKAARTNKRKVGQITPNHSTNHASPSDALDEEVLLQDGQDDNRTHRVWRMTVNNYTQDDFENMKLWAPRCVRIVIAREVGKEAKYLQCRMTWKQHRSFAEMKHMLPKAFIEVAKTDDFAHEMKTGAEEVFYVDNRSDNQKSDLGNLISCIRYGDDDQTLSELWPFEFRKYYRMIKRMRETYEADEEPDEVKDTTTYNDPAPDLTDKLSIVVWGEPGLGISKWVKSWFERPLVCKRLEDLRDLRPGPRGHDGIIFDGIDFSKRYTEVKHFLDKPKNASVRLLGCNALVPANKPRVFITRNHGGALCKNWQDLGFQRRIKTIHVTSSTTSTTSTTSSTT